MENEILLGDAYELIKSLPDDSIDCVYTDIPYLIPGIHGGKGVFQNRKHKDEIASFCEGVKPELWDEIDRVLKKMNLFVWCSKEQIPYLIDRYAVKQGLAFNILVWCKTNPTPFVNGTWLPDIEYCLHFKGSDVPLNDGVSHKSKWFVSGTNTADKKLYKHPSIKPVDLVERHLLHATQPNDLVLDPFMGSGTTAVACKRTGRRYLGFELSEDYHKIALDRLNGIDIHGRMSLLDTDFDKVEAKKPEQLTIFDFDETKGDNDAE